MENAKSPLLLFALYSLALSILLGGTLVNGAHHDRSSSKHGNLKLFVFGDSYADTGNLGKLLAGITSSWFEPYGMTFPKRPAGRFSDGRVFTDFVASIMKVRSPIPFKYRKYGENMFQYGMNFAVGGSGVFDTGYFQSNLTEQIGELKSQIKAGIFSENDIKSAVVLIVISGNDYVYFMESGGPDYMQHIPEFINRLFIEFKTDLLQLQKLGFKKVIVNNLHPIGFTPRMTRPTNYTSGPEFATMAAQYHNHKMAQMINDLNKPYQTFFLLDLYAAFMKVIKPADTKGSKLKYLLVPCCRGNSNTTSCGELDYDHDKAKAYTVCSDPEQHFYWDDVHPTQAGWAAVTDILKPRLRKILN